MKPEYMIMQQIDDEEQWELEHKAKAKAMKPLYPLTKKQLAHCKRITEMSINFKNKSHA